MLPIQLGYDEIKTNLAMNKYGEGLLSSEQTEFLRNSPMSEVAAFEWSIKLANENILDSGYSFNRIKLNDDSINQYIVMDSENRIATLISDKMSRNSMLEMLVERIGITDTETVNAIISKAETTNRIYKSEEKKS
ncbi:hypothetical protein FACS189499_07370 [Clostridia bacterium]|nr:hypothetical protein FACS189499_07370 [Clostridia bacterium]